MEFKKRPKGPFNVLGRVRRLQEAGAKAWGRPTSAMRTNHSVDGRPVIFIHTPQTGGTSLGRALGVQRRSHATPSERLSEAWWIRTYSVVAVRNPFDRFASSYWATVDPNKPINGLVKMYGPEIKSLTPFEFLDLLALEPSFGGSQLRHTTFPSTKKPEADLILRFEEIGTWAATLKERGVVSDDFSMPHLNRKPKKPKDRAEIFRLDEAGVRELKRRVVEFFAEDYRVYGYDPSVH